MNINRVLLVGACLATFGGLPASGQVAQTAGRAGDPSRGGRAAGVAQGVPPDGRIAQPPGRRGAPGPLVAQQREIQQAVARVVRNQLSLNDEQMGKLREIDMRYTPRRVELEREEVRIRNLLANAMANPGRGGNDARITLLLDSLRLGLLQGRLEVERGEQRELGAVLAPRQLAQYFFIREQVRQRLETQAAPLPPASDSAARGRGRRGG